MLDHANDAASVSLGTSAAHQRGGQYIEASTNRAYERVHNDYESYRASDNSAAPPTVGKRGATTFSEDEYRKYDQTWTIDDFDGDGRDEWNEQAERTKDIRPD